MTETKVLEWETLGADETDDRPSCVRYYPRWATVYFGQSNVAAGLRALLKDLLSKEEVEQQQSPLHQLDGGSAAAHAYTVTQVAVEALKMRVLLVKVEEPHSDRFDFLFEFEPRGDWSARQVRFYGHGFQLQTNLLAPKLKCERVVFADALGKPTKKPIFVLEKNAVGISITAPIVKLTDEEFKVAFPSKQKKTAGK